MPSITVLSDNPEPDNATVDSNTAQTKQKPLIEEILDSSENNSSLQNESIQKIEPLIQNDVSTTNKKVLIEEIQCPVSSMAPTTTELPNTSTDEKTGTSEIQENQTQAGNDNSNKISKLK